MQSKASILFRVFGSSFFLILAMVCNVQIAQAQSAATQGNFGQNLPQNGLLTIGQFNKAQKANKAATNNPNNPANAGTTGQQTRNQFTQFNSYNNNGNWQPGNVLTPAQQFANRGPLTSQPGGGAQFVNPAYNKLNPPPVIANQGGGLSNNDLRNQTSMGDQRLKFLESGEGAEARNWTQPNMQKYQGSDQRTTEGKHQGVAVPATLNFGLCKNCKMWAVNTPMSAVTGMFPNSSFRKGGLTEDASFLQMPGDRPVTDGSFHSANLWAGAKDLAKQQDPQRMGPGAAAEGQQQGLSAGNSAADLARNQAASAITYVGSFIYNFTTEGGNKWNQIRDRIFVPMAILLLLPGACLAQAKAIVAAGFPVVGETNPFEGILRSIIAIFLIPATYLVVNYGIDLCNSITYTIASEYYNLFGTNMYQDAICAEVRATPVRKPENNRNALDLPTAQMGPMVNNTIFAKFEGLMIENALQDPCLGLNLTPPDRADEALNSAVVAARLVMMTTIAGLTAAWNVLCAFQMAYLYYLWCVGPIMAALWVWPLKTLRNALPSWIEGVVTICFWSLFWNTVVLLMACFKGIDETGTVMMAALNFLATASVKHAFDFAALAKQGGAEFANMAMHAAQQAASQAGGKGGGGGSKGGGGGGGGGKGHAGGHHGRHHAAAGAAGGGGGGGGGGGSDTADAGRPSVQPAVLKSEDRAPVAGARSVSPQVDAPPSAKQDSRDLAAGVAGMAGKGALDGTGTPPMTGEGGKGLRQGIGADFAKAYGMGSDSSNKMGMGMENAQKLAHDLAQHQGKSPEDLKFRAEAADAIRNSGNKGDFTWMGSAYQGGTAAEKHALARSVMNAGGDHGTTAEQKAKMGELLHATEGTWHGGKGAGAGGFFSHASYSPTQGAAGTQGAGAGNDGFQQVAFHPGEEGDPGDQGDPGKADLFKDSADDVAQFDKLEAPGGTVPPPLADKAVAGAGAGPGTGGDLGRGATPGAPVGDLRGATLDLSGKVASHAEVAKSVDPGLLKQAALEGGQSAMRGVSNFDPSHGVGTGNKIDPTQGLAKPAAVDPNSVSGAVGGATAMGGQGQQGGAGSNGMSPEQQALMHQAQQAALQDYYKNHPELTPTATPSRDQLDAAQREYAKAHPEAFTQMASMPPESKSGDTGVGGNPFPNQYNDAPYSIPNPAGGVDPASLKNAVAANSNDTTVPVDSKFNPGNVPGAGADSANLPKGGFDPSSVTSALPAQAIAMAEQNAARNPQEAGPLAANQPKNADFATASGEKQNVPSTEQGIFQRQAPLDDAGAPKAITGDVSKSDLVPQNQNLNEQRQQSGAEGQQRQEQLRTEQQQAAGSPPPADFHKPAESGKVEQASFTPGDSAQTTATKGMELAVTTGQDSTTAGGQQANPHMERQAADAAQQAASHAAERAAQEQRQAERPPVSSESGGSTHTTNVSAPPPESPHAPAGMGPGIFDKAAPLQEAGSPSAITGGYQPQDMVPGQSHQPPVGQNFESQSQRESQKEASGQQTQQPQPGISAPPAEYAKQAESSRGETAGLSAGDSRTATSAVEFSVNNNNESTNTAGQASPQMERQAEAAHQAASQAASQAAERAASEQRQAERPPISSDGGGSSQTNSAAAPPPSERGSIAPPASDHGIFERAAALQESGGPSAITGGFQPQEMVPGANRDAHQPPEAKNFENQTTQREAQLQQQREEGRSVEGQAARPEVQQQPAGAPPVSNDFAGARPDFSGRPEQATLTSGNDSSTVATRGIEVAFAGSDSTTAAQPGGSPQMERHASEMAGAAAQAAAQGGEGRMVQSERMPAPPSDVGGGSSSGSAGAPPAPSGERMAPLGTEHGIFQKEAALSPDSGSPRAIDGGFRPNEMVPGSQPQHQQHQQPQGFEQQAQREAVQREAQPHAQQTPTNIEYSQSQPAAAGSPPTSNDWLGSRADSSGRSEQGSFTASGDSSTVPTRGIELSMASADNSTTVGQAGQAPQYERHAAEMAQSAAAHAAQAASAMQSSSSGDYGSSAPAPAAYGMQTSQTPSGTEYGSAPAPSSSGMQSITNDYGSAAPAPGPVDRKPEFVVPIGNEMPGIRSNTEQAGNQNDLRQTNSSEQQFNSAQSFDLSRQHQSTSSDSSYDYSRQQQSSSVDNSYSQLQQNTSAGQETNVSYDYSQQQVQNDHSQTTHGFHGNGSNNTDVSIGATNVYAQGDQSASDSYSRSSSAYDASAAAAASQSGLTGQPGSITPPSDSGSSNTSFASHAGSTSNSFATEAGSSHASNVAGSSNQSITSWTGANETQITEGDRHIDNSATYSQNAQNAANAAAAGQAAPQSDNPMWGWFSDPQKPVEARPDQQKIDADAEAARQRAEQEQQNRPQPQQPPAQNIKVPIIIPAVSTGTKGNQSVAGGVNKLTNALKRAVDGPKLKPPTTPGKPGAGAPNNHGRTTEPSVNTSPTGYTPPPMQKAGSLNQQVSALPRGGGRAEDKDARKQHEEEIKKQLDAMTKGLDEEKKD